MSSVQVHQAAAITVQGRDTVHMTDCYSQAYAELEAIEHSTPTAPHRYLQVTPARLGCCTSTTYAYYHQVGITPGWMKHSN
jgi:hypothetical protein